MHAPQPARYRIFSTRGARTALVATACALALLCIGGPVLTVFWFAFSKGLDFYLKAVSEPATRHAVWMTVVVALAVVPINTIFGIAAAWAVTRFSFRGRGLLLTLIELPFSISPIVAGTAYLFLYGMQGLFGATLAGFNIKIMFTVSAIFLASMFVTSPFVARELITAMQAQGTEPEEAAHTLGASGFSIFRLVTLPNIRWALLYGAVLCNARVMGEFGAVSIVSGNVRGETNTLPLQVELLFQDQNTAGAFAAASLLTAIALLTLLAQIVLDRSQTRSSGASSQHREPEN